MSALPSLAYRDPIFSAMQARLEAAKAVSTSKSCWKESSAVSAAES